jgi:DNA-binding GntR family transcriptional regulator
MPNMPNTLDHPELRSHAEAAYQRIRDLLVNGELPSGTALTERQLSADLAMSRTPVREAVRRLQADGLIAALDRGLVVAALSPSEVIDAYEVRAALEALAAELAAIRSRDGQLAPAQIGTLREHAEAVAAASAGENAAGASQANLRFHRWIAGLAGNAFVEDALRRLWDRIAVSSLSNLTDRRWSSEVADHHDEIVAAIAGGEPERAASVMRAHIRRAAEVYASHPPASADAAHRTADGR